jgi:16S rRNA (guanine966-N2)-methyltransferase
MHIIAGIHRNKRLISPKGLQTRPTASHLREALFNICQNDVVDSTFLDLCAGSGGIGLEALSRGASFVTFVEHHRDAAACIRQNIQLLNEENKSQILQGDVLRMLESLKKKGESFSLIYADPPYHTPALAKAGQISMSEKLIRLIDESLLLSPGGTLFIEEAFEYAPALTDLKSLVLKKSRRVSSAVLQQYESK